MYAALAGWWKCQCSGKFCEDCGATQRCGWRQNWLPKKTLRAARKRKSSEWNAHCHRCLNQLARILTHYITACGTKQVRRANAPFVIHVKKRNLSPFRKRKNNILTIDPLAEKLERDKKSICNKL